MRTLRPVFRYVDPCRRCDPWSRPFLIRVSSVFHPWLNVLQMKQFALALAKPFATIHLLKPFAIRNVAVSLDQRTIHARIGFFAADGRRAGDLADSLGAGPQPRARRSRTPGRGQRDELLD